MPSGIVYVIAEFSMHAARVVAAGRPSAESVLGAFLDDFLPRVGLGHVTGCPRFVACGAEPPPQLSGPWRLWAQAAAATLVIFDTGPASADACAVPPQNPVDGRLAPVSSLPAERTGIIEYLTGPDSGFAHPLPIGAWTMGRTAGADIAIADPYLSRELLTLRNAPSGIHVSGPGGPRSIPVGSTAALTAFGSTAARLIPPRASAGASLPSAPEAVSWPRIATVARPRAPSWLMYVAPIAIGILLAVFTQMWMFLLFSVSGPVTAGIMFLTGRRRYRREVLAACQHHRAAVRECLRRLGASDRAALDAAHRRSLHAGEAAIGVGRALLPGGIRDIPALDAAADASDADDPLRLTERQQLDQHLPAGAQFGQRSFSAADQVPLIVDLTRQRLIISGPVAQATGVLRAVLAQLLARSVPVAVVSADLLAACPELAGIPLAPGREGQADGIEVSGHPTTAGEQARWQVQIGPAEGTPGAVETWMLRLGDDAAGQLEVPDDAPGDVPRPLTGEAEPTLMRPERFLAVNRSWQPPAPDWQHECGLGELIDHRDPPRAGTSAVPLGRGPQGPALIDLFTAGPHALLAGTTGSGKSVLLQTWIVSLAARYSSAELRFVLIDFKGGAAFAPFTPLTHTDAVVSNLDPAAGMRTLRNLGAEILRRERLLAAAGAADLDAFNAGLTAGDAERRLPRLVVIIDEFHALIAEHPAGTEVLESLTAVGRSLGIHVVLATQRPAGIVTPRMKANINLRIALRVRDGVDSREVIECEDAAGIPAEQPGLGFLSDGGPPVPFRTATIEIGAPAPEAEVSMAPDGSVLEAVRHCDVQWTSLGGGRAAGSGSVRLRYMPPPEPPALTVAEIVSASRRTASGLPPPHQVVPAPLPDEAPHDGDPTLLGIVDFPDDGVVQAWRYDPARDGSVVITGGSGAGATSALLRCAQAAEAHGKTVVLLTSTAAPAPTSAQALPEASAGGSGTGFLTFSHDQPWSLEYLLALVDIGALDPAEVCPCIDDYEALVARHETSRRVDRLLQLLTAGGTAAPLFVVVAGRRFLHSPVASRAPTRIVFPTNDAQESLHYGLPAGRFSGVWPPGRAVVLGPVARSQPAPANASEGVAVQLVRPDAAAPAGRVPGEQEPMPRGVAAFARADEDVEAYRLGRGPLGEDVVWVPAVDGPALTVRGPAELCQPLLTGLARPPADRNRTEVMALIDAHEADPAAAAQAAAAEHVAISYPLTAQLPYSSPLKAATSTGPQLLIGLRQQAELSALGLRDLPLPPAGWAWFVSGSLALPVDIRPADGQDSEIVS